QRNDNNVLGHTLAELSDFLLVFHDSLRTISTPAGHNASALLTGYQKFGDRLRSDRHINATIVNKCNMPASALAEKTGVGVEDITATRLGGDQVGSAQHLAQFIAQASHQYIQGTVEGQPLVPAHGFHQGIAPDGRTGRSTERLEYQPLVVTEAHLP